MIGARILAARRQHDAGDPTDERKFQDRDPDRPGPKAKGDDIEGSGRRVEEDRAEVDEIGRDDERRDEGARDCAGDGGRHSGLDHWRV